MKVLIVGGVAGGASAAARLRRNDENAGIILFERGEYISFANCGLPYFIGDVITDKEKLTLQTPESFYERFRVDVRVLSEVVKIDRQNKKVTVLRHTDGKSYEESYDKLVLSPGAVPIRPKLPGFDHERVFTLRNIPDTTRIKDYCLSAKPQSAVVIGGGYIGIEMAENLHKLGVAVTVVEMADHIIAPIDVEMAAEVQNHLRSKGVSLVLGQSVNAIHEQQGKLSFALSGGQSLSADFAVLSVGVRPDTAFVKEAGIEVSSKGAILVDDTMKTSDDDIYAAGDAVEVRDFVSGAKTIIPLASPANKQGRIIADNLCGKAEKYDATQGSAVIKVFDLTVAATGNSEAGLKARGVKYLKNYTFSAAHASYYPGGLPINLKLLFSPDSGKILGAQAVGFSGVDKRIDVIATVMRLGGTVNDLTKLELCYAPPFSSAKDPVNMAGYAAENILNGVVVPFFPEELPQINPEKEVLLDVRTGEEFANGSLPGALNIPVDDLRGRLEELPKDKPIKVFCQIGLRGYVASRILMQSGFADVKNLSGGYRLMNEINKNDAALKGVPHEAQSTYSKMESAQNDVEKSNAPLENVPKVREITVDACGLSCPGPIMSVNKAMTGAEPGDVFVVKATDPAFEADVRAWCSRTGNELLDSSFDGASFTVKIKKGRPAATVAQAAPEANGKSLIVFSGDLDKAIASFIIANGAAAMGREVNMFFTFWGLNILRKGEKVKTDKDFLSRMFGRMMPRGSQKLGLSRMNMGGMGAKMIRGVMKKKNITSLEDLVKEAIASGVKITACSMSMDVMGIKREELIDGIEIGGVATFLASAESSDASLFI